MELPVIYNLLSSVEKKKVREEYIKLQKGLCSYCGELLDSTPSAKVLSKPVIKSYFPPDFFKWPVHLHHNHETGLTIGAVHNRCNAVLWIYHGE